jgi:hypothetical protein
VLLDSGVSYSSIAQRQWASASALRTKDGTGAVHGVDVDTGAARGASVDAGAARGTGRDVVATRGTC